MTHDWPKANFPKWINSCFTALCRLDTRPQSLHPMACSTKFFHHTHCKLFPGPEDVSCNAAAGRNSKSHISVPFILRGRAVSQAPALHAVSSMCFVFVSPLLKRSRSASSAIALTVRATAADSRTAC